MSETDGRRNSTELRSGMLVSPVRPDRVYGAPDAYKGTLRSAMREPSLLARPSDFPIRVSPWSRYQMTYRLRFGVDFWLTGARQRAKPCDEVFVQELPDTIGKEELQRFLKLRHRNIHAVLDVLYTNKAKHLVFEHMEVSLHEIATVGINTAELATILKQVCALSIATLIALIFSRLQTALCTSRSRVWNMARSRVPVYWSAKRGQSSWVRQ
jgi:hypothetical protein